MTDESSTPPGEVDQLTRIRQLLVDVDLNDLERQIKGLAGAPAPAASCPNLEKCGVFRSA